MISFLVSVCIRTPWKQKHRPTPTPITATMFRNNKSKTTTPEEESGIMAGWSMPSSLMTTTTEPTKPKSRFQRHSQLKALSSPSSKKKVEKRSEEEEGTIVAITGLIREPASSQVRAPPPSIETSKSSTSNNTNSSPSLLLCAVGGSGGVGGDKKQKKVIYRNFTSDPKNGMEVWTDERDGAGIPEPASNKHVVIKIMVCASLILEILCRIEYFFTFSLTITLFHCIFDHIQLSLSNS